MGRPLRKSRRYIQMVQCADTAVFDGITYRCINQHGFDRGGHKGIHTATGDQTITWGTPRPAKAPLPFKWTEADARRGNAGAPLPAAPTAFQRAMSTSGDAAAFLAGALFIVEAMEARAEDMNHGNWDVLHEASRAANDAREVVEES